MMNRQGIIRMAREAGFHVGDQFVAGASHDDLERFAAIVADAEAKRIYEEGMVTVGHMREQILAEREACAQLCDEIEDSHGWSPTCARAIRSMGQA
jgi:hypothetical protein